MSDAVNHPKHYTSHPSGVECIEITEHFGFNLGNVIKYLWRAEEKGAPVEDLKKARWYLDREIQKREEPIQEWPFVIKAESVRVGGPGGWVLYKDGRMQPCDENGKPIEDSEAQ
ncbi:DUF3310 domain-containing protein [Caballeronia sp. LZ001]|uniref:DUF3310 domain-containing protein n=1 Tax=Caballeronia sp. LZ001 TaxID=3038553 RepID=UPI0028582DD9|nr:DUF3310 domain-containing protein [Caballeronia sp. LZ001]MDR5801183.1 DUF3310 domain-containing protein [Caballeronia sp. LZ001]